MQNSKTNAGGVGIYIEDNFEYEIIKKINLDLNNTENLWVKLEINKKRFIIGAVYCHPVHLLENLIQFSHSITEIYHKLNSQNIEYYVLGDFNIHLFQIENNNQIGNYANDLASRSIKCLISQPTRICRN